MTKTAWILLGVVALLLAGTALIGGFSGAEGRVALVLVSLSTIVIALKLWRAFGAKRDAP